MSDLLGDLRVDRELRLRQRIDQLLKQHHQDIERIHRLERTTRTLNARISRLEQRIDLWKKRAAR